MDNNTTAQMLSSGISQIMQAVKNIEKGEGFNLSEQDKEKFKAEFQKSAGPGAIEEIKKKIEELKTVGK